MTIWTQALASAVEAVARETIPHPYGHEYTDTDVKSRAREFMRGMTIGGKMSSLHQEYFVCLYSRLDSGSRARDSHIALRKAWAEAMAV